MGDIRLQSLTYQDVLLNEQVNDGKFTLVMIWSTDCVPCEQQKPMIQAFHDDYSATQANVIGIANDGMEMLDRISELLDKHTPNYPNFVASPKTFYSDFEIATGKKFRATPTYIMYDPDGNVAGVAAGPITRELLDKVVAQ